MKAQNTEKSARVSFVLFETTRREVVCVLFSQLLIKYYLQSSKKERRLMLIPLLSIRLTELNFVHDRQVRGN